jgi:hypothetical protein
VKRRKLCFNFFTTKTSGPGAQLAMEIERMDDHRNPADSGKCKGDH